MASVTPAGKGKPSTKSAVAAQNDRKSPPPDKNKEAEQERKNEEFGKSFHFKTRNRYKQTACLMLTFACLV